MPDRFKRLGQFALRMLYPPRCGGCDRRGTLLCEECKRAIVAPGTGTVVVSAFDDVFCAGVFSGPLREAVHKFKYQSDTPLAEPLGALLAATLSAQSLPLALTKEHPVLMAVPLHSSREKQRGFNQALLLAQELEGLTGWTYLSGLARVRITPAQVGLDSKERRANVAGAFKWSGGAVPAQVVLVDDVCTTGATLSECARVLRTAGVQRVYAAVVAIAAPSGPEPTPNIS